MLGHMVPESIAAFPDHPESTLTGSPAPRPSAQGLDWTTLLGGHLSLPVPSRGLLAATAGLSLALVAARLLGWSPMALLRSALPDSGTLPAAFDVLHFGAELAGAGALVAVGLYMAAWSRTSREATPLGIGLVLASTGLLEAIHAATAWRGDALVEPPGPLFTWTAARLFLAAGLVGVLALGNRRSAAARRGLAAVVLGSGALAATLVLRSLAAPPDLLIASAIVPRPWELAAFGLFVLAGLRLLGPFHRRLPTPLTHALIVAMLPLAIAQLAAGLGWVRPFDPDWGLAHLEKLLATGVLAAGLVLDGVGAHRRRLAALERIASTEVELNRRTAALEQVDRELVAEAAQRRRAEASLRMVEKAVATMSLGATITDPEGRILFTNAADAAMHGYSVDELVGRPASVFAPADHPGEAPASTVDGWEPWSRETYNVTRDGRVFPVRLVSDAVLDDEGRSLGMVTICEDISARRQIEDAVRRRDQILQAIGFAAERLLAGESWEDEIGEILRRLGEATAVDRVTLGAVDGHRELVPDQSWTGPGFATRPGPPDPAALAPFSRTLARGEIARGRARDLAPGVELPGTGAFLLVPILAGGRWSGVLLLETSDKERRWSDPELTALEAAARTLGAAVQRRIVEAAVAASESRLRRLLENASDLVHRVGSDGRLLFVNRAWRTTLGYDEPSARGLALREVVEATSLERLEGALAGGETGPLELQLRARDGRPVLVEATVSQAGADPEGSTLAILRDVTERRRLERLKSEFVTTVSHELRTPLTSLIASLSLVRQGLPPDDADEMLAICARNGERLLRLIDDLLDLQKLAVGKLRLRSESFAVPPLLEEARNRIRSLAEARGVRLEVRTAAAAVRADRHRLAQVVDNLLSNAIKFSPRDAAVVLAAETPGDGMVEISVADSGPGIPEGFRDLLFEPFSQLDGSPTRETGGTGLGLHIARRLVRAMEGEIDVETSTRTGSSGTVFRVRLPTPRSLEGTV